MAPAAHAAGAASHFWVGRRQFIDRNTMRTKEPMRDMPAEYVDRPMTTRRQQVEHKLGLVKTKAEAVVRHQGIVVTGVALTALAALGVGIIIYRRRQHQSLAERLHSALPWSVPDLPEEFMKGLKRPLRLATRVR